MSSTNIKILALCGSLRPNSSNHTILQFLAKKLPYGVVLSLFEGIDQLPHFNHALDVEDAPEPVARLRNAISEADAVIVSTPEYAFGVPGSLSS